MFLDRRAVLSQLLFAAPLGGALLARRAYTQGPARTGWLNPYRDVASRLIHASTKDDFAWRRLAELTDTYGHRLSGSENLERAIVWAAETMKRDGLENVRMEPVMVPRWVRGQESAEILSPPRHPMAILGLGGSISTPAEGIEADVVVVNDQGEVVDGRRKPSSETPLHTMVMRARPDLGAIVHTHAHYSTVVSCMRPFLPPILTESCLVVGARVPVTRYGLTGTPDFGESVVEVLTPETRAVIIKNHGLISFGDSFDAALTYSEIVEEAAKVYIHALAANGGREPDFVPEELIPEMTARFRADYGQPKSA